MLLVDHHHAQAGKLYGVFNDGMGADKNLYGTVEQTVENLLTFLAFDNTCQHGHADIHPFQEVHDGLQVLFGKNLRRCHNACLIAVVQSDEHRHQGYEGLARAYVALQETIHLFATTHILTNLANDALLGLGEWEGKVLLIERVEVVAHLAEYIAAIFATLVARVP